MKNKLFLALGLLAYTFTGKSQSMLYTENVTSNSVELNWSFDLEPKQNIYFGVSAHSSDMATFNSDAGKTVGINHKFLAWGASYNQFDVSMMNDIRNGGSIPLITWEPWNYIKADPQYSLKNIINGNFDTYIKDWATAAKNWNHPFFLRFAHEMNGKSWYPWQEGFNGNSAGEYIQAYRHVFNIFKSVGANNAVWVWCPNVAFSGSTAISSLYPGDDYVHWVSLDGYNRGSLTVWQSFSSLFGPSLKELQAIAPSKKIMIAEVSSSESGGSKAAWITDALSVQLPANPNIKAFVWFNNATSQNWTIESSTTATAAFKSGVSSSYFMGNIFNNIGASSYTVRYKPVTSSTWTTKVSSDYALQLTGLQSNTEYEFQVQATLSGGGISSFSASKKFTTDTGNTITGVTPVNNKVEYSLSFYPNPFSGKGYLKTVSEQTQELELKIIDIKGAVVYYSKDHFTNEKISLGEELSAGIYFLQIKQGEELKTIKFVKSE